MLPGATGGAGLEVPKLELGNQAKRVRLTGGGGLVYRSAGGLPASDRGSEAGITMGVRS